MNSKKQTGTDPVVDLDKVIEYGRIPEVSAFLASKLAKRGKKKGGPLPGVERFKRELAAYREQLYVSKLKNSEGEFSTPYPPLLYWFELTQYKALDWRITNIDPYPPSFTMPYAVLPKDIIMDLAENLAVDPERVKIREIYSQQMKKKVRLEVVRYSKTFIMGTVNDPGAENVKIEAFIPKEGGQREIITKTTGTSGIANDPTQAIRSFYQMLAADTSVMEKLTGIMVPMLPRLTAAAKKAARMTPERFTEEYSRYDFIRIHNQVNSHKSKNKKRGKNGKSK